MTYIIPSIIAAVIIFFFARRLNKLENEEAVLAMDTPDTQDSPLNTEGPDAGRSSEPNSEDAPPKSEDEQATSEDEEAKKEEHDYTAETVKIIVDSLSKLGCQPVVEDVEDDHSVVNVKYQGENFQFFVHGIVVNIYDLPWTDFNISDPNAMKIRKAINNANFSTLPMVIMLAPDDEGNVSVMSRYETILHPSCTINDRWITNILDSFFQAQRKVRYFFNELIAKHDEPAKNRRPVGFATE